MPSIIKLTPAHFTELYETLLRPFDARMPKEFWQRAFSDRGWSDEDYWGYLLTDAGRMVGMLGTIFSQRLVNGSPTRFCNLHSWFVLPEYRVSSLLLMRPVLALKDHIVTDLSATSGVVTISQRLGFTALDPTIHVLYPWPQRSVAKVAIAELAPGDPLSERWLTEAESRILRDHQQIECGHLLLHDDRESCYVVYSRVPSRWAPHCSLHYLGNPDVFFRHQGALRRHLLRDGCRFISIQAPLLGERKLPRSFRARGNYKLVRSAQPPPTIDTLYSEVPLLKLPEYPRPPRQLRWLVDGAKKCRSLIASRGGMAGAKSAGNHNLNEEARADAQENAAREP